MLIKRIQMSGVLQNTYYGFCNFTNTENTCVVLDVIMKDFKSVSARQQLAPLTLISNNYCCEFLFCRTIRPWECFVRQMLKLMGKKINWL